MIEFLMVADAPKTVAPFTIDGGDGWLFVTGQMPTIPQMTAHPCRRHRGADPPVMDNLKIVLADPAAGSTGVVFARVYLTHFERDYAAMNGLSVVFRAGRLPARTCIASRPGAWALVEIDSWAQRCGATQ